MVSAQEALSEFLANRMSLEAFEDWSASFLQSSHRSGDNEAQEMAREIRSILNAFEDDENDFSLRQELANAIRSSLKPTKGGIYQLNNGAWSEVIVDTGVLSGATVIRKPSSSATSANQPLRLTATT